MIKLGNDWDEFVQAETAKPYYLELRQFLKNEYATKIVYPPAAEIFNALKFTAYTGCKVVILGQDPYINPNEAHGLAFSVLPQANVPPSLRNIFQELHTDLELYVPNNGHLVKWANQGVMLLNTVLTVQARKSKSHSGHGWEKFTNSVIERLNARERPIVFMLWGRDAQSKVELITGMQHLVLTAAHPSPLAGGKFFGCRHFSRANAFLREHGMDEIDWQVENI